jgi:hypothetical protein
VLGMPGRQRSESGAEPAGDDDRIHPATVS